jgi:hypothetical protein
MFQMIFGPRRPSNPFCQLVDCENYYIDYEDINFAGLIMPKMTPPPGGVTAAKIK